jgi:hypothetical protein
MENDDLLVTRLGAHMRYIAPRIRDENKRNEFILCMLSFIDGEEVLSPDHHGGTKLAFDTYNEIKEIHNKRFVTGRSEDAYLERI